MSISRLRGHNCDGARDMLGKKSIDPRQIGSMQTQSNKNYCNGHKMLFSQLHTQSCFSKKTKKQKNTITIDAMNTFGFTSYLG